MKEIKFKTIEVSGFVSALQALRLSYGKPVRSQNKVDVYMENNSISHSWEVDIDKADIELMSRLIKNGDEHAKVLRGILVYVELTLPRYAWQEVVTYDKIGSQCLMSESTMHIEGKGLPTKELVKMKENLTEGHLQTRIYYYSYQTLRRIYKQRKTHRLPFWGQFCQWIEGLPFSDKLITI